MMFLAALGHSLILLLAPAPMPADTAVPIPDPWIWVELEPGRYAWVSEGPDVRRMVMPFDVPR